MKRYILNSLFAAAAAVAMISCTGNADPDNAGSGLEMKSSAYYIAAGGSDEAYLSVWYDGKEVTGSPDITVYIIEESGETSVYEDTAWSSEEECEVRFYAEWNNEVSEPITVAAVNGIAEVPEDPDPDEWSRFAKNTLMVQGTSVGCPYCPYVMDALDKFFNGGSDNEEGDWWEKPSKKKRKK